MATVTAIRGPRPKEARRIDILDLRIMDVQAIAEDAHTNAEHTLQEFDEFLSDGYLSQEEAVHLRKHLRLGHYIGDTQLRKVRKARFSLSRVWAAFEHCRSRQLKERAARTAALS